MQSTDISYDQMRMLFLDFWWQIFMEMRWYKFVEEMEELQTNRHAASSVHRLSFLTKELFMRAPQILVRQEFWKYKVSDS